MEISKKNIDLQILSELRKFKLFAQLSPELLEAISKIAVNSKFKKGSYLWQKDDPGHFFTLVTKGIVEISKISPQGNETVFGIFGPGDLIGVSAVLKKSSFPANAVSVTKDTEVVKFYIHSINQNLEKELKLELLTWLKESILVHEQILREKIEILSSGKLDTRIPHLFTHLLLRFGIEKNSKQKNFIPFPISKTQIARLIEVRVETIIRYLGKCKKEGSIIMGRDGILIPDLKNLMEKCKT